MLDMSLSVFLYSNYKYMRLLNYATEYGTKQESKGQFFGKETCSDWQFFRMMEKEPAKYILKLPPHSGEF